MTKEIKAEFRKIFSVRSTYVIFAIVLVLLILVGFYVTGWHSQKSDLTNPTFLFDQDRQAISFLAIFPALIGLLLFTHEFRYNTIFYSLTLSNSRSKVLWAKMFAISAIAIVTTVIVAIAAPLLGKWGLSVHHAKLVHQHFSVGSIAWRGLAYGWGYAMAALVLAALVRNQIGAIIALFVLPGTVEGLLSIWLKGNTVYLPFSALKTMLGFNPESGPPKITEVQALLVFLAYLVIAWVVSWYLFIKRDAN